MSLAELVAELDLVSRRRRVALDVTSGAFVELAGDRGDAAQTARVDLGELVLLPRVEDLAETELARRFAQLRGDPEQRETLLWALRGSGSLVCFRDAARRLAVLDEWTFERNRHIAEWAVRWLDRNALDYHRDLPRWGRLRRV